MISVLGSVVESVLEQGRGEGEGSEGSRRRVQDSREWNQGQEILRRRQDWGGRFGCQFCCTLGSNSSGCGWIPHFDIRQVS